MVEDPRLEIPVSGGISFRRRIFFFFFRSHS
jgi:hypothetical protein